MESQNAVISKILWIYEFYELNLIRKASEIVNLRQ